MRPLKRPMFKYGGDVKRQGIMHGMNGLRDGGVATTMADALGMANGGIIRQGYNQGLSVQPNYMGGPMQNFYESIDDRPDTNIPVPKRMTLKDKIFRPAPNPINLPGPNKIDRSNPQVVADLEAVGGDVQKYYANQNEKNKIAEEKARKEAKSIFAPSGVYEYDREEGPVPNPDKKIDQGEITADGYGNKSKTILPRVTSNKEKDADRLKRIYDIMGVDDAKKDAAYNALIDLSQGQAIDTKDISGSINRAIGALSKRADKVTDLKDKGKAALASGTIQDIFKDKRGQYLKNAEDYANMKGVSVEEAYKQLNLDKEGSIGQQITDMAGKLKTKVNEKVVTNIAAAQKNYQGAIMDKKEFTKAIEDGKYTDVLEIVNETQGLTPGDKSKDGIYTVGVKVIIVTNGIPKVEYNL